MAPKKPPAPRTGGVAGRPGLPGGKGRPVLPPGFGEKGVCGRGARRRTDTHQRTRRGKGGQGQGDRGEGGGGGKTSGLYFVLLVGLWSQINPSRRLCVVS